MKRLLLFSALVFALVFSSEALQCQQLTVQTDSGKQVVLNRADLEALPHIKVTAGEHSSGPVNFEGVTLKSVLEKAGVAFGESMKGKRLTNCLLVEAADGYRAVIALPELDPAFTALSPNLKDRGRYAEIPADEYPPIEQACVILSSSKNKEIAQRFLSDVKSAAVADLLVGYGFDVSSRTNKQ